MITIPKQFYVGLRKQEKENDLPLGFATPYDDNHTKAFEKRKNTVDTWTKEWDHWQKDKSKHRGLEPKIVDNQPLEGFKIAEDVRRIYWGGGNVVWRMVHPEGFEFEIPSSNLARIIDCATITNGVIQGKCLLGRDSGQNLLLPEGSEPYKEAFTNTVRAGKKVSAKDIAPGDVVVLKDGREATYYGTFYAVYTETKENKEATQREYYTYTRVYDYYLGVSKKRMFFKEGKNFFCVADAHVSELKTKGEPISAEDAIKAINKVLSKSGYDRGIDTYMYFVAPKPIKDGELTFAFVNATLDDVKKQDRPGPMYIIERQPGDQCTIHYQEAYAHTKETYNGYRVVGDLLSGKYRLEECVVKSWIARTDGQLKRVVAVYDGKQYDFNI